MITYALCAPADDDSSKVDDFDDDWGLDDLKPETNEEGSSVSEPDVPKGPISYIQKIPRRGEKPVTQAPVEIVPQEGDDIDEPKRERRDTLTREQKREQRRQNKKLHKQNKELSGQDGQPHLSPDHVLDDGHAVTKRPRKQKTHKQQKVKNSDDTIPTQGGKKQRAGGKKNKEGKKEKNRPDGRPTRQGKNGQRQNKKQKQNKHQPTESTLQ